MKMGIKKDLTNPAPWGYNVANIGKSCEKKSTPEETVREPCQVRVGTVGAGGTWSWSWAVPRVVPLSAF